MDSVLISLYEVVMDVIQAEVNLEVVHTLKNSARPLASGSSSTKKPGENRGLVEKRK